MAMIREVRAFEGEIVSINWVLSDGSRCTQRVTVPPKAVRDVRAEVTPVSVAVRLLDDDDAAAPV